MFMFTSPPEQAPIYDIDTKPLGVIETPSLAYTASAEEIACVQAPLTVHTTKVDIIKDFNVNITDSTAGSAISLKTDDYHRLQSRIHLSGKASHTAEVRLESLYGKIVTEFPTKEDDQPVRLIAKSMHGKVKMSLPVDFDGIVVIETFTGHIRLGDPFKARATVIPNLKVSPFYLKTYRVRSAHPDIKEEKSVPTQSRKVDACYIKTIHGCIRLDYASEANIARSRTASKKLLGCVIT